MARTSVFGFVFLLHTYSTFAQRTLCGSQQTIETDGGKILFQTNAWNASGTGFQCMSVNNNYTAYNATWSWPSDPGCRTCVHSYPHIKFIPSVIPLAVTSITNFTLAAEWSVDATPQDLDSATNGMVANVAWDLFLDPDPNLAQIDSKASWEVMIWMGRYGGPAPIGHECLGGKTVNIGDIVFDLSCGPNPRPNLTTFSFLAKTNTTNFNADFSPLFQTLLSNNLLPSNVLLGVVGFGQEAFYAANNVTLEVKNFAASINGNWGVSCYSLWEAKWLFLFMSTVHVIIWVL